MSKVATIVTNDVEDIELTSPLEALNEAGHKSEIIENKANKNLLGKHGYEFKSDKGIDDVSVDEYDALLIPGGFSPDQLRADERFVQLVKDFILSNKPVFAICHGPQIFIQTGLTNELTLTSFKSVQPDLFYAGAQVKDEAVVVDEKHQVITSRTPDDLDQFNKAIVDSLK